MEKPHAFFIDFRLDLVALVALRADVDDLGLQDLDVELFSLDLALVVLKLLVVIDHLFLDAVKLVKIVLNALAKVLISFSQLRKLVLLSFSFLHAIHQCLLDLVFQFLFDAHDLLSVVAEEGLVFSFLLLVGVDLVADLCSEVLVALHLLGVAVALRVEFVLDDLHLILELVGEFLTFLAFDIEHLFVLEVELVIVFEEALAHAFENFGLVLNLG